MGRISPFQMDCKARNRPTRPVILQWDTEALDRVFALKMAYSKSCERIRPGKSRALTLDSEFKGAKRR